MQDCGALFESGTFSYNDNHFTLLEKLSFCLITPLSVIAEVLLLYLYSTRPYLRRPPGDIILWQMLGQLMLDLGWLYSAGRYLFYATIEDTPACRSFAIANIYAVVVCCGSNVFLTIEIFVKISRPFDGSEAARRVVYSLLLHLTAVIVSLIAAAYGTMSVTYTRKCFFYILQFGSQ